jgi:hypothetical protein
MWILPRHRPILALGLAVGCIAALVAGCAAGPRTMATFQTQDGTISLQQSTSGGTYAVSVGPRTSLPLDGYTSAHIDSIWNWPGKRLVVISGAGTDCRSRYTLVIAEGDAGSLHAIGECGDTLSFAQDGNTVAIRQIGVRNPKIWTFRDGALNGPFIQTAARPSRPAPEPVSSRAVEGASDATSPPVVSAPVGDEVIPSPVGGPGSSRPKQ